MTKRRAKVVTLALLLGVIGGMAGLTAAAVPLYQLFRQVTGYGGATRVALAAPSVASAQTIEVRFNADVARGLPWSFRPVERAMEVRIGEPRLAYYRVRNDGDRPIVGSATVNVTPHRAGPYFAKIECFCFTEQRLEVGQSVEMPVSFFVDPAILDDPDTRYLRTITLSYTFFARDPVEEPPTDQGAAGEGASS